MVAAAVVTDLARVATAVLVARIQVEETDVLIVVIGIAVVA
jgi:hypothetical protein